MSARITCPTTRCTNRTIPASAAPTARGKYSREKIRARGAGLASRKRSADCTPRSKTMSLFPMFVKLDGRRCLVVGAGNVAEGKIEGLLTTGAAVRVVAPVATPKVRAWAREGRIEWEAREYVPADLGGAFLV